MINDRLTRLFDLFEQVVSHDRFGHRFPNQHGPTSSDFPAYYRAFIAAPHRYLPSNWQLFSHFGHDLTSQASVQSQLLADGMSSRWIVFGKTGDEDFLLFDTDSAHQGAVVWCDADVVTSLEMVEHYTRSFADMIHRVTQSMAEAQKHSAEEVLTRLASLSYGRRE